MRFPILILTLILALVTASAQEKEAPKIDPFADPVAELARRAENSAREKKFNELKEAAEELAQLSRMMSDEIAAGNKDVLSAKVLRSLDRAEKLLKTMRSKVK
jgi:hypothetical protein